MTRDDLNQSNKRAFRDFFVRGPFSMKELADEIVTEQWMRKVADPEDPKGLDAPRFGHLVRKMFPKNPNATLDFVARILACPAIITACAPKPDARAKDVEREAAEATVATSDVQREVLTATADGFVSPEEAAIIRCKTRQAERELVEVAAAVEKYESAQGSLPVEVRP